MSQTSKETSDPVRTQYPKRIIYPTDFFPHANSEQQSMVDEFVGILESFLGVKKTEMSFEELWVQSLPDAAKNKTLKEYLEFVSLK